MPPRLLLQPKPGYVYAMETPALPGLVKVGHTHRPPHRRALELSRTALPLPFEVRHARFFWDAPGAEKRLHKLFAAYRPSRKREFFSLGVADIASAMDMLDHRIGIKNEIFQDYDPDSPFFWSTGQDDWAVSREGLEEQWSWAMEELSSQDPSDQRQGWARMEALSASGWAEGSWRLAEIMMERHTTHETARRAAWVLDAAASQGHQGAHLRASWLRSFQGSQPLEAWKQTLIAVNLKLAHKDVLSWPDTVLDTLKAEMDTWTSHPDRIVNLPIFFAIDKFIADN